MKQFSKIILESKDMPWDKKEFYQKIAESHLREIPDWKRSLIYKIFLIFIR